MSGAVDTSHELASFLRTRRERIDPAAARVAQRRPSRRRTPGLRREEVAELAHVSVDYVTRLEQGRGLRPSPEVLDALAAALRLSDDERAYLFDLARQRPAARRSPQRQAGPMAQLVRDLSPLPAMLTDYRFDILAWNPEMAGLMLDFAAVPARQRNTMRLCLLHPAMRDFYADRERVIREGIADLRAAWAARPEDASLGTLIGELSAQSPEFARLWSWHDVRVNGRGRKPLRHPRLGPLAIRYEVLAPLQEPDRRLIIYRAADPASQAVLDVIAAEAAAAGTGGC
jgi:transcriptional regulator with XRE-family HTH domain